MLLRCTRSMIFPLVLQWWFLQGLFRTAQSAGTYYFFCEVDPHMLVTLQWNDATNQYEKVEDDNDMRRVMAWKDALPVWMDDDALQTMTSSHKGGGVAVPSAKFSRATASLTTHEIQNVPSQHRYLPSVSEYASNDEDESSNSNKNEDSPIIPNRPAIIQARLCPCSENPHYEDSAYYCDTRQTYCAVPASYYNHPQAPLCLDLESDEIFARSIWPIILIWFCLSLVFCLCTRPGRYAVEYVLSTVRPSWNERVIRHWLQRQPGRAHELWRRHWDRERYGRTAGSGGHTLWFYWRPAPAAARKVEFVLKTCLYHAPTNETSQATSNESWRREEGDAANSDHEDDEERATCSICFIPLEEGVKIGKLQCRHLFHSECIKGWIQRRNACPLCLDENIAVPRHDPNWQEEDVPQRQEPPAQETSVQQPEAFL